jgi:hypothetical protein
MKLLLLTSIFFLVFFSFLLAVYLISFESCNIMHQMGLIVTCIGTIVSAIFFTYLINR